MPLERLILLRHGNAERRAPSGEDFDRALTERGRRESRETGARLAEAGFSVDLALVSEARRARETWEEAGLAFPAAAAERRRSLYHASPADLWLAAEEAGARAVILVGHNPGMHALAFDLTSRGRTDPAVARALDRGFPTASAAVFRFEGGRPTCEAFVIPHGEEPA